MKIYGKPIDEQTRCVHYHSPLDVIAIKFKCCGDYYPCFSCHAQTANHNAQVWSRTEFETAAIYCGVCKTQLTINQYLQASNQCPHCNTPFNPGCQLHYHLYFEMPEKAPPQKNI